MITYSHSEIPLNAEPSHDGDYHIANSGRSPGIIIFVYDEAYFTELAVRMLSDEGFTVVTTRDSFQAMHLYKKLQAQVELVILANEQSNCDTDDFERHETQLQTLQGQCKRGGNDSLCDLPGIHMDGFGFFKAFRKINPQAPLVLCSGYVVKNKLEWMLANGLRGFIPKPLTPRKLLIQVHMALAVSAEPAATQVKVLPAEIDGSTDNHANCVAA